MSNMSYCRFENTLPDLQDCEEHIINSDLSKSEQKSMENLINLCVEIAISYGYLVCRNIIEEE